MTITKKYQAYLNSPKWKSKRRKVLQRAGHRCEKCKKRQATETHHLTYDNIYNEPLSDLLAVCAPCHRKIHGIKEKKDKPKRQQIFGGLSQVFAKVIR